MPIPRLVQPAMFNASTMSAAVIDRAAFQSTIRRENTSTMNATYTTRDHVEQYVKSATHFSFRRTAVKSRLTRSGARTAAPIRMGGEAT
jgi:hypothetical protein